LMFQPTDRSEQFMPNEYLNIHITFAQWNALKNTRFYPLNQMFSCLDRLRFPLNLQRQGNYTHTIWVHPRVLLCPSHGNEIFQVHKSRHSTSYVTTLPIHISSIYAIQQFSSSNEPGQLLVLSDIVPGHNIPHFQNYITVNEANALPRQNTPHLNLNHSSSSLFTDSDPTSQDYPIIDVVGHATPVEFRSDEGIQNANAAANNMPSLPPAGTLFDQSSLPAMLGGEASSLFPEPAAAPLTENPPIHLTNPQPIPTTVLTTYAIQTDTSLFQHIMRTDYGAHLDATAGTPAIHSGSIIQQSEQISQTIPEAEQQAMNPPEDP
jgi:hypothetical protein